MSNYYVVTCGNIGLVYEGPSKKKALAVFREYSNLSLSYVGKAAGEAVHLSTQEGEDLRAMVPTRWEVTDTFGGESNYSWVQRGATRTLAQAKKAVRQFIPRARVTCDYGDQLELRHSRICRVGFIYRF